MSWRSSSRPTPGSVADAKIINSNGKALLLWDEYKNHGNGWVDLKPLTVIFMPDENVTDTVERWRHAVVMEVPEGANLRFDRPLDLNKGGIGRLIEGKLRGPVRIRSQGKRPDHQDDLLVLTHDVDLSEQRITTASDVDFQWGPELGPRAADGNQALAPPGTSRWEPGRTEHRRHRAVPTRARRADAPGHGFGLGRYGPAGRTRGTCWRVEAGGTADARRALLARRTGRDHLPWAVLLPPDRTGTGGHLPRPG